MNKKVVKPVAHEVKKKVTPTKKAVKAEEEVRSVAAVTKKVTAKRDGISVDVYDTKGKVVEQVTLPKEIFGAPLNESLMKQAVHIYLTNQRRGTQSTKTRGEVTGSTRKIYQQKGTGRARHGGIRAPIFVGGGVALGPKPREFAKKLPQKMKRVALFSALTSKVNDKEITFINGLEKLPAKTKQMVAVLHNLSIEGKTKKVLLVTPEKQDGLYRAARNIEGVTIMEANRLNVYEVLNHPRILFMKSAIEIVEKTFGGTK